MELEGKGQSRNPRVSSNSAKHDGSLAVLKLSMVTPDDSGEYTVVAENAFGKVCSFSTIFPIEMLWEIPRVELDQSVDVV
ncbi:hypothetical protein TELCIR_05867 [Teladorsagia circumcincta]|uniref:Immunoglobulin I-set domain-containing protein n=1 Tax=Teladorsagia circumcincta TaxID=45464 RepID=A0A2G9UPP8_TELCI|nr:hypothetical protein TELCIR_05867 [Teladorsagia circumcincta]